MMLLSLLGPSLEETRATSMTLGHPRNDSLSEWFTGSPAHSGVLVSQHSAMTVTAVFRAIALISGCASRIPIHVYRDRGNDHHEREAGHPYETLLNVRLNDEMDAQTGRECLQAWTLASGTAPAEVVWGPRHVEQLWPIKPSRVSSHRLNNRLFYKVTDEDGGNPKTVPKEKLFSLIGPSPDGIVGYSPIRVAREAIGLALATERYGAGFFGNGAVPKGVLYYEGQKSEQAERHFREMWNETHQSPQNSNKTAILRAGWKYQQISVPPEDAQFLATRKFTVSEIARLYGVAPHLLGDLDRATFNNIEQMSLEFLLYCLDYWLNKWESRLRLWLFTDEEISAGYYLKHDRRQITAMDAKTRAEANKEAINAGYRTANEARVSEGDNPRGSEGDLLWFPMNTKTAKTAEAVEAKEIRDAQEKPAEQTNEPAPVETPIEAAEAGKTAQTGLAGQQITALQGILTDVVSGSLPKKTAKTLITVSFPLIDIKDVNAMVDAIEVKPAPIVPPAAKPPEATPVAPPAAADAPAPPPKTRKPKEQPKPQTSPRVKAAARRNLSDALGRMRRIERNESIRAAQKPAEWSAWMESFWLEHEERMRSALAPAAEMLSALLESENVSATPSFVVHEIVRQHCTRSKAALMLAVEGEAETLSERVKALFDEWEATDLELPEELASVR